MAVYRENPKCASCGADIEGIYRDESHLPMFQRTIGDTFEGWNYEGHKCVKNTHRIINNKPVARLEARDGECKPRQNQK